MKPILLLTIIISVVLSNIASAGLKIYYIRHAEGGHNVKKAWEEKGVPESEWPAYVGNPDMFTPRGLKEVVGATEKLQQYSFDFVAASPLWRARNTILPYLELTKQKGEVWPELKEAKGMLTILSEDIPDVTEDILNMGKPVEIPADEQHIFKVREGAEHHYLGAPKGSSDNEKVAYTKHASLHIIQLMLSRFGDGNKSVLLAGHNSSGVSLLKLLLQEAPHGEVTRGIESSGIWMVEQQEDGSFQLKMFNDKPYEQK